MFHNYYYFTTLSNWILGFDKYTKTYSKSNIHDSSFPDKFFMLQEQQQTIGIEKAKKLLTKLKISNNQIIRIHISLKDSPIKHERGWFLNQNFINVEAVSLYDFQSNTFKEYSIEEITALSYKLENHNLKTYQELNPRSISILPIANACQARCWFCFSESSISIEKEKFLINLDNLELICQKAKQRGASRFVITGGGEPTLLNHELLLKIIKIANKYFEKIILITNGYEYCKLNESDLLSRLNDLIDHGLSVLAISRHHYNLDKNLKIMGIKIQAENIFNCIKKNKLNIKTRLICVLQKNGIENEVDVQNYIDFAKSFQIEQICFKELYVSSQLESIYANKKENKYSENHQVDLSMVTQYLEKKQYIKTAILPWGSPVYKKDIEIACYTEPSVGWEKLNGIARSWNIMADGKVYASLEDLNSELKDLYEL